MNYSISLVITFIILSLHCHPLINIKKVNNSILTDIRYATPRNFTGKTVYKKNLCYIHKDLAPALNAIQQELSKEGLGLKIWDAYRSQEAQQIFWDLVHDKRYVSHPDKGYRTHMRGIAIDVTLIDLKTKKELAMPTEFDNFTKKAHAKNIADISPKARANRDTLQKIMTTHGFTIIPHEWWHFQLKNWKEYPILTTNFSELSL